MFKIRLVIFLFTLSNQIYGQSIFSLNAMTYIETQKIYRGAQIWEEPNMTLGLSMIFFERLEWRGPLLDYHFFKRDESFVFDLGLRFFSDSGPQIELKDGEKDYRNQRGDALDFLINFKYKFGWKNLFSIGFQNYKELIEHYGTYFKVIAEGPILPYTKLSIGAGMATKEANQFVYGPQALSGFSNLDIILKNVIVSLPWKGIIINQLGSSHVLGSKNKSANFIKNDSQHYFFNTRFIFNLY